LRGKAIWLLPLTFVGVMSLGGISGAASYLVVPSAEVLILFCIIRLKPLASSRLASADKMTYFERCHGLQVWQ
jgi:urease accessory protein